MTSAKLFTRWGNFFSAYAVFELFYHREELWQTHFSAHLARHKSLHSVLLHASHFAFTDSRRLRLSMAQAHAICISRDQRICSLTRFALVEGKKNAAESSRCCCIRRSNETENGASSGEGEKRQKSQKESRAERGREKRAKLQALHIRQQCRLVMAHNIISAALSRHSPDLRT
jgi:hypothetical protein